MNRRQFFGMTAAALAGYGLSELLLPRRTLFLPPAEGWVTNDYAHVRYAKQYTILNDSIEDLTDWKSKVVLYGESHTEIWEDVRTGDPISLRMVRL